jgi:hypothetical protein
VPTYETLARFDRDFAALTKAEQDQFLGAVQDFISDLRAGRAGGVSRAV